MKINQVRKLGAFAGFVVLLGTTTMIAPAQADHEVVLECGDIITEDTVLGADIGPCGQDGGEGHGEGGHALRIQASDITIDLNGHTIFGFDDPNEIAHQAAGIKVEQQDNVTIFSSQPGGTIRDLYHGVWILGGSGNQVGNVDFIDNTGGNGILMQNAVNSTVVGNLVEGGSGFGGISVFNDRLVPSCCPLSAENNRIEDNVVRNANGAARTVGISIEAGSRHRIVGNVVEGSGNDGIRLTTAVSATRVIDNEVRTNGRDGIHLQENIVNGASADRNLIQGNRVGRNGRDGIQVNGENNRILGNTSLENTGFDLFDRKPDCDNNIWSGNVFGTAAPECTTAL